MDSHLGEDVLKTRELAAAGITGSPLTEAYHACGERLRTRNPAAYPSTRCLLPAGKRPYYDAFLAFCRHVDDLVDDPDRTPQECAARLDDFQAYLAKQLQDGPGTRPAGAEPMRQDQLIATAFAHFTRTWGITAASVELFLRTLRTDLEVVDYPTYQDLEGYMRGVSGEPTTWVNALLEPSAPEAEEMAVALSHGLYLLHFAGDLAEDLRLGRVYLPEEDLARFGTGRDDLASAVTRGVMTEPVRLLVRHQALRVHRLLAESEGWHRLVHPSAQRFARRYHALGRDSLHSLVRNRYDVLRQPSRARAAWDGARALGGTGLAYAGNLARRGN